MGKVVLAGGILLLLLIIVVAAGLSYLAPRLKDGIAAAVTERTGRPVELSDLSWSLWPRLEFRGQGLEIGDREGGAGSRFRVESFTVQASPGDLWSEPRAVELLELHGLEAKIARREEAGPAAPADSPASDDEFPSPPTRDDKPPVKIRRILATDARIEIGSKEEGKPPRLFEIDRLELDSFDLRSEVAYRAWLRYPKPPGDLDVEGRFGPVPEGDARLTPYLGDYLFREADLGVFGGIAGMLHSRGSFSGTVADTQVTGSAEIPDFRVTRVQNIVPLKTNFTAYVRENGAVIALDSVDTSFHETLLTTTGSVNRVEGREGRHVSLRVTAEKARIEDLLLFAVDSEEPPMTGQIKLDTQVSIPPGKTPFIQRLRVEGEFEIGEGRFSNVDFQKTLEQISQFGTGEGAAEAGDSVVSDMRGNFLLEDSKIRFRQLRFGVPGMELDLTGTYRLEGETLDFAGRADLERPPSEMVSGRLGRWIRIIDPLLRRGEAGTSVPIKITGTRSEPKFSVDFGGLLR